MRRLGRDLVELFPALIVDGERAASVEGDLGLETELGGEVAVERDAATKVREANNEYLGEAVGAYKAT